MIMKLLFFQFLFKKISSNIGEYITVKYFAESAFAKELYQATEDAAGYDLFTAKQKLFFLIQPVLLH